MKIKNLLLGICAMVFMALSFVGCQDYDNGYTEQQLKFIQGFKDVFGEIDHSNDWNLAEQGTVTVTTSKPSRIKIYANTFGTYKIVGDYENINDTQTLTFDMVEGTTDILVSDGQTAQKVKVGDVVVFSGTRYVYTGAESKTNADGSSIVSVGDENSWEFFEYDTYVDIVTNPNTGHLPEDGDNLGNVTQNFTYISDGPFTIYPLYMFSVSCHILGVYWKETSDSGEEILHSQPVYRNNGMYYPTDEWVESSKWEGTPLSTEKGYYAKPITINLPVGTQFGFFIKVYNSSQPDEEGKFLNEYKDKLSHVVYSSGTRNTTQYGRPLDDDDFVPEGDFYRYVEDKILQKNETVWAGTFTTTVINSKGDEEEVVYLGFEDWGVTEFDLNDLVFIMKGDNLPIIIDEDPTYWVLSWEDLGGTFDLDYNDVVIKVGHIAGKNDLEVVPLAAGGTLASFLYFNDGIQDEDKCLGEIHSYFGQEKGRTSGTYTPVNVDIDKGEPEIEANITDTPAADIAMVSPTWSLSTFTPTTHLANRTELEASKNTMGGFYIKVVPEGEAGTQANADKLGNKQKIQNRPIDTAENVPYVICTPYNWRRIDNGQVFRGTYRWPREHVPMLPLTEDAKNDDVAYTGYGDISRAFEAWVGGRQFENGKYLQTSIYWYRYPNVAKTVGDTAPTSSGGSGSSGNVEDESKENPNFTLTSQNPVTLMVNDTYELGYTYEGQEEESRTVTITVVSGNDVISCNGKTITALKQGTAQITLYLSGTDIYSAATITVDVTVVLRSDAEFNLLTENGNSTNSYDYTLKIGSTHQIRLDDSNVDEMNIGVTYSSSDENVAIVTETGEIKPISTNPDPVVITVTSGSTEVYASKTATVYVTVVDGDIKVEPGVRTKVVMERTDDGNPLIPSAYFVGASKMSEITIHLEAKESGSMSSTTIWFNIPGTNYWSPSSESLSSGNFSWGTEDSYSITFTDTNDYLTEMKINGLCLQYLDTDKVDVFVEINPTETSSTKRRVTNRYR